jgi:hypothetical protein
MKTKDGDIDNAAEPVQGGSVKLKKRPCLKKWNLQPSCNFVIPDFYSRNTGHTDITVLPSRFNANCFL